MPINFQQIHTAIRSIGEGAQARKERLEHQRERAWKLLELHSADLDLLRQKVERAVSEADANLRCALPLEESLLTHQAAQAFQGSANLLAIDGSQIVPDRHEALLFGLINIGAVTLRLEANDPPDLFTESELLFEEDLRNRDGSLMDEGGLALKRDAQERARLLELAGRLPSPVVALTDGPVELWGAKDPANAGTYKKFLQQYLDDLDRLNDLGVTLGGYVDKPAADLVTRLLEVAIASDEELKTLREYHPLAGATDLWLFGNLLKPGERSAVMALQSSSRPRYSGKRAIHFFYLNVSRSGAAWLARVEFPKWVAEDPAKIALLHGVLMKQCGLMGAKPYPYILHRAHETARVSFDEKEQIKMLIALELRNHGGEVGSDSNKQGAKDNSGKKRSYGR
jgi:hypothetical protein